MKISNSKVRAFTQCRRLFDYKYNRDLEPKSVALPLKRGTWLHALIEAYYKTGDWKKKHKELTAEYDILFDEEKDLYGDLPTICGHIMQSYVYQWRKEDAEIEIVAVEEELEIPLPHGHTFSFTFDRIIKDEYGTWLVETKSHRSLPGSDYRFIDSQSSRYVWGLERLKKYGKITGVIWDYLVTTPPTVPKLNKDGRVSRRKIKTDLLTYVRTLRSYGVDLVEYRDVISRLRQRNDFFRRERVPKSQLVMKTLVREMIQVADEIEGGYEPIRTISRACEWCSFKSLCITELYGGDAKLVQNTQFRPREKGDYGYQDKEEEI